MDNNLKIQAFNHISYELLKDNHKSTVGKSNIRICVTLMVLVSLYRGVVFDVDDELGSVAGYRRGKTSCHSLLRGGTDGFGCFT